MGTHRAWAVLVAVAAIGLAACETPPSIDGSIVADSSVNPDPAGRPSPIVVKLYEVTSADGVASAGFFPLFEEPGQVLGNALLKTHEYIFGPGESRTIEFDFDLQTRYIVVVAAYRDIDRSQWWAVQAIRPGRAALLDIRLDRTSVVIRPR